MVLQFTLHPKHPVKPADDDGHTRTRAAVFAISASRTPDGTARYSSPGHGSRRSGSSEFRSWPDPGDGGDAA